MRRGSLPVLSAVAVLLLLSPTFDASRSQRPGTVAAPAVSTREIAAFPGLGRIFRELASAPAARENEAGRLFDFELVIAAVSGQPTVTTHSIEDYRQAFAGGKSLAIAVSSGAARRDDTAYRLHSLGYSAKEIADILSGRITRSALDNAHKMLMLGSKPDQVSDFLDREYAHLGAARQKAQADRDRLASKAPAPTVPMAASLEADIVRLGAQYGVDARLIRAVIECESGWNPAAVSRVGAVGLMQLMPGTAGELGVDPRDPHQNVEGGVRYLAWLLRLFKRVDHALVAYNAGPGFAARFARGEAALYGETREFVKKVLGMSK